MNTNDTQHWLMKSEPDVYSIDDLRKDGSTPWEGVRNYQARNFMRDDMKMGDRVIFYHSNATPPGAAGWAVVSRESYPDQSSLVEKGPYFDPKSSKENPRWHMVDVEFREKFPDFVSLQRMREVPELGKMRLLQKGARLSVMPITEEEFMILCGLGKAQEKLV